MSQRQQRKLVTVYTCTVMEDLNHPGVYTLWMYDRVGKWREYTTLDAFDVRGEARTFVDGLYLRKKD